MKITVLTLYLLCGAAWFGQSVSGNSALSSQPQQIQMASHSERASAQPLAQPQDLRETAGFAYAQGRETAVGSRSQVRGGFSWGCGPPTENRACHGEQGSDCLGKLNWLLHPI